MFACLLRLWIDSWNQLVELQEYTLLLNLNVFTHWATSGHVVFAYPQSITYENITNKKKTL